MFLVALTHQPIPQDPTRLYTRRTWGIDGGTFTILHDLFLVHIRETEELIELQEQAPLVGVGSISPILTSVRLDRKSVRLDVETTMVSGRLLYYHRTRSGDFYIASHLSLLHAAGVAFEADARALPEFMLYRHLAPPRTLISDIKVLPAGSSLNASFMGAGAVEVRPSSTFSLFSQEREQPDAPKQVRELLEESISALRRYPAAAFLLSGGLDSSILFACGRKLLGTTDSYATSYPFEQAEQNKEERYARSAAAAFGSSHHHYVPSLDDYRYGLISAIAATGQPVHHLQSVLLYLLFHNGIPKDCETVVSGEGADTLFGTRLQRRIYWATKWPRTRRLIGSPPVLSLLRTASQLSHRGSGTLDDLEELWRVDLSVRDPHHLIWDVSRYGSEEWILRSLGVSREEIFQGRLDTLGNDPNLGVLDLVTALTLEADIGTTETLWSSLCESSGKFLYFPFSNRALVSRALSIPWEQRLAKPKAILRAVARDLGVPRFIMTRKKSGFSVSPSRWALPGTVFDPLVPLVADVFPESEVRALQAAEMGSAMTYWNLLNYGLWKRLVVDNVPADLLKAELQEQIERRDGTRGNGQRQSQDTKRER